MTGATSGRYIQEAFLIKTHQIGERAINKEFYLLNTESSIGSSNLPNSTAIAVEAFLAFVSGFHPRGQFITQTPGTDDTARV
jgi:hypothetical protein